MLEIKTLIRNSLHCGALKLKRGESIVITGPSGAGKSQFFRAIADLDPNEGDIYLDGKERNQFSAPEWRRDVMFLPANSAWWGALVGDHFSQGKDLNARLEQLGLPSTCMSWPARQLSTGERQRLALIRTLILNPKVLLLDEPTSSLDGESIVMVENVLLDYREAGGSFLLITHNDAQAKRFGPRQFCIANQRITEVTA